MGHIEQFTRSINIWKITEGEYIDIYVDMYLWMESMFKDLNIYTSDKYPLSTFYGTSIDNILVEQNLKNDGNYIQYDKVYSVFLSKYKGYVSDYIVIMSIFQEYLGNTLELKGSHTEESGNLAYVYPGNILELKGGHTE